MPDQNRLTEAHDLLKTRQQYETIADMARAIGVPRTTLAGRLEAAETLVSAEPSPITFPTLPPSALHPHEIIARLSSAFQQRWVHERAKVWPTYRVNIDGPYGICWLGDPHVDDNGCNWPTLSRDLDTCRRTYGMFAANIGDSGNNWSGRLERLWSQQDTSRETAGVLIRYLLQGHEDDGPTWHGGTGPKWLVWLFGNHDQWGSGALCDWMREIGAHVVPMYDWQVRFVLTHPAGQDVRIWAAHDFAKAHSMWNSLHSAERTAKMKDQAHLYICGHQHNWALKQEESASRDFTYWLARARGYKFIDSYGEQLGHNPQNEGAAIVSVINPTSRTEAGLMQCFADTEAAADYLTWLRARKAA